MERKPVEGKNSKIITRRRVQVRKMKFKNDVVAKWSRHESCWFVIVRICGSLSSVLYVVGGCKAKSFPLATKLNHQP